MRTCTPIKVKGHIYHNNPKYWDENACANSVDPDQMPHSVASDQGQHCLPLIQKYFRHIDRLKNGSFKFQE